MATRSRKPSSEESSATQTGQKRAALYVPSHASTIADAEQQERLEIIERIPEKPGATKRYTDGYESKYRDQVLKDLDLLASCCVRGRVNCSFRGKRVEVSINGPYLTYSIVMYKTLWTDDAIAGVFASPGDWI